MNVMAITIGRGPAGKLTYAVGNKMISGDDAPNTVSQKHIQIDVTDKNELILTNLNIENVTYVNGLCVERKLISSDDCIELGFKKYKLTWEVILGLIPNFADIRHLKKTWNEYQEEIRKLNIEERLLGVLRTFPAILTVSLVAVGQSPFFSVSEIAKFIVYSLSAILTIILFVVSVVRAKSIPLKMEQLKEKYRKMYICPVCKNPLPFIEYEQLIQQLKKCPRQECYTFYIT